MSTTQTHSSGYRSQTSAHVNGSVIVGAICSATFMCLILDVWPSLSSFWQPASKIDGANYAISAASLRHSRRGSSTCSSDLPHGRFSSLRLLRIYLADHVRISVDDGVGLVALTAS